MSELIIKDACGKVISLPELVLEPSPIPKWKTWGELAKLAKDSSVWNHPRLVYLASADQWLGIKAFFDNNNLMECDTFYSVIGGLGGLNFLSKLKKVKKVVFYDSNSYALRILDLQIQLIKCCSSVNDYISNIYQRPFDMSKYVFNNLFNNLFDFLKLPIDNKFYENLKKNLSPEALRTYNYYYLPYINAFPSNLYNGPTVHCTWLLPCFERSFSANGPEANISDALVVPLNAGGDHYNTFYVGKGWLENDKTFLAVRQHLLNLEVEAIYGGIGDICPDGNFSGVYMSNICSTDPGYIEYEKIVSMFHWAIGYDDYVNWEVKYYPSVRFKGSIYVKLEGMVDYLELVGEGNTNTHATCCEAINGLLDLNSHQFLEVIAPPKGVVDWGFRFYKGQKPVSVNLYLSSPNSSENIIVLHILLGAGVDKEKWEKICRKAVEESKRYVLIFEHRKECTDWPEEDVCENNLLGHRKLDQFIYSLDYRWKKYGMANLRGDIGDVRNILYFLDKGSKNA